MADAVLVLDAQSSSLTFSIFLDEEPPRPVLCGRLDALLTCPQFRVGTDAGAIGGVSWQAGTRLGHRGAIDFLLTWGQCGGALGGHRIVAVGHRVVHGAACFAGPALIDEETRAKLAALARRHRHTVVTIEAVAELAPAVPQVACFDTNPAMAPSDALAMARHTRRLLAPAALPAPGDRVHARA